MAFPTLDVFRHHQLLSFPTEPEDYSELPQLHLTLYY